MIGVVGIGDVCYDNLLLEFLGTDCCIHRIDAIPRLIIGTNIGHQIAVCIQITCIIRRAIDFARIQAIKIILNPDVGNGYINRKIRATGFKLHDLFLVRIPDLINTRYVILVKS